jgi:hypothetical protein
MLTAFMNDPQMATDMLVAGKTFEDTDVSENGVYNWVSDR